MLGHENHPCKLVTSHLSEDMGHAVSSMGVFGDPWTNNDELKSFSETQSNTTEPHPTSCKFQGGKKIAGRDKWNMRMRALLHRTRIHSTNFILRTSHESQFPTSGNTHHPNCHPQRKDTRTPHLTEAPAFRKSEIV